MTTPAGLPERRPSTGPVAVPPPATAIDLDRLRASAASALSAELGRAAGAEVRPRRPRVRWVVVGLVVATVAAWALMAVASLGGGDEQVATRATSTTAGDPTTSAEAPTPTTARSTTVAPTTAATTVAPDASAPPPHRAVYRAGKLYLEGRITSAEEAQKYVDKAAAVLGPDNVVNDYVIDPTVPLSNDGTVDVDEPFLFETGSAELNPSYTGILGLGIAALRLSPAARMVVTGYTDNVGDPAGNLELSTARAMAVVDFMVSTGGIDRSRFDAVGAGDRDPIGDNDTAEGRALNRRIDVKLVNLLG